MKVPQLYKRRQCCVPTTAGWFFILSITIAFISVIFFYIHPFLSPSKPINGDALIIEGWLPDGCLESAAKYFHKKNYKVIFVTGGPLESGSYLKEYHTYAFLGAATLKALSVPDSSIIPIPAPFTITDRTYTSAVAFKKWIDSTKYSFKNFDLISEGTHTRRTVLLFKRALGKQYRIGSIAIPNPNYNPKQWWRSSTGVRAVIDESIAYLYALLFVFFQ